MSITITQHINPIQPTYTLHIPLEFYFNRNPRLALPILYVFRNNTSSIFDTEDEPLGNLFTQ